MPFPKYAQSYYAMTQTPIIIIFQRPDDLVPVHFRSFPRAQFEQALTFVKSTVPVSATRDTPTITMTGVGTSEFGSVVERELGVT